MAKINANACSVFANISDLTRGKTEADKALAELSRDNPCWARLGRSSVEIDGTHLVVSASIALEDIRVVAECTE